MPASPKRQHQVSRGYLNRFGIGDSVFVRRRDGRTFESNTLNVAVESGFYDVPDSLGGKSFEVEHMLADLDGVAVEILAGIDVDGVPPAEGTRQRLALAVVLAFQLARTTEKREEILFATRVSEYADGREITQELVANYLEQEHLGFPPRKNEAEAAWIYVNEWLKEPSTGTKEFAIGLMLASVDIFTTRLLAMNWTIEIDRKERFITSDVPVVLWRAPSRRDDYQGFGLETAEELRFPIDPSKQLVLSRKARTPAVRITSERVRICNRDMADRCHHFLVARRDQRAIVESLSLASRRPVIRFMIGPLWVMGPDGRKVRESEVLQMWIPRRPLNH